MRRALIAATLCLLFQEPAMAIDLTPLLDFSQPAQTEQRLRAALQGASADDQLILQTQIARTHGLRRDLAAARALLSSLQPQLAQASAEAQARWQLEWGRTWSSAAHDSASQTPEAREQARQAYQSALAIARKSQLDGLAVDALHMMAFVDTAPADQLRWDEQALALIEASSQPAAKKWEASLRNNAGYALHTLGRYPEALTQFERALVLREQAGDASTIRVARWMIAWTLRALKRDDEALALQQRLERECEAAGEPDEYVFEELEILHRARGDEKTAAHYGALRKTMQK